MRIKQFMILLQIVRILVVLLTLYITATNATVISSHDIKLIFYKYV